MQFLYSAASLHCHLHTKAVNAIMSRHCELALPCCTTWLDTAMRSYFAWHIADNLQGLDRQPLFENIFQSHSSVAHTCKDCWYRVAKACDPTLCLHAKGSVQAQVFRSHHFVSAWKRLDAAQVFWSHHFVSAWKRLDAIPSVSASSLCVCMEKARCSLSVLESSLCVCMGKARCNPKCFGVITLCLHGKGSMQSQVFRSHHFVSAWKRLAATQVFWSHHFLSAWKRLDPVPSGMCDPMPSV